MYNYGYDSSIDSAVGGVFAALGFLILFIVLICLAVAVLTIVGQWKAFKKAGKGGWEAIIPVYSQVVNCQIVGVNPWWVLIAIVGSMVLNLIPVIGSICSLALSVYFAVILNVSTARSFGKSDGFAAGLYFLPFVFWLIVGGKNTEYLGPKPMKDVVMDFVQSKTGNGGATTTTTAVEAKPLVEAKEGNKFCTSCGAKINEDQKFCPSCGKEVK